MFLALRDLRHARGRFTLMTVVLVLVTVLVTFLSALTAGLARASTSAVTDLPADRLAFAQPAGAALSFTGSQVTRAQWLAWGGRDGVRRAEPLGVATVRASATGAGTGSTTQAVTAFGVEPGSALVPDGQGADVRHGTVVVSRGAASALGVEDGDAVDVQGDRLRVAAVVDQDADFSHTPVVWVDLDTWQAYGAHGSGDGGAAAGRVATVVALWTAPGAGDASLAAGDEAIGTQTVTLSDARSAVGSFTAENLSLTVMQAFLLAISALVVGAFFTVWTMNRAGDLAVVKALGGSTSSLVRDALGQALVVLLVGVGAGAGLAAAGAALARGAVPVVLDVPTFLVPATLLVGLGMLGAVAAVWRITRIDPHAALQAR